MNFQRAFLHRCLLTAAVLGVPAGAASRRLAGTEARPPPSFDLPVDGDALVRKWLAPVTPPAVQLQPGESLRVGVRFVVDAHGQVTSARVLKSPDPRLNEAAVACVKAWGFTPALEESKPVPCCLDVMVVFAAPNKKKQQQSTPPLPRPRSVPLEVAEPDQEPPGDYPTSLDDRKISGRVEFACHVDETGVVSAPRILNATHVDFVLPALQALGSWKFHPAHRGDLTVASEVQGEMDFDQMGGTRADLLAANGITGPDGAPPADQPQPLVVADSVWPYESLVEGKGGAATVNFTVSDSGRVENVEVRDATQPEFGRALAAAIEAWHFQPAISGGHTIAVPLAKHAEFKVGPGDGGEDPADPIPRLLRAVRAGGIGSASGLDGKLTPIFRVSPRYPQALLQAGRPTGTALIEIVIARDGRARLPRIVSASQEEFGWSAATALAQWIFLPPLRHGVPVDVKVQVPVNFKPPES